MVLDITPRCFGLKELKELELYEKRQLYRTLFNDPDATEKQRLRIGRLLVTNKSGRGLLFLTSIE